VGGQLTLVFGLQLLFWGLSREKEQVQHLGMIYCNLHGKWESCIYKIWLKCLDFSQILSFFFLTKEDINKYHQNQTYFLSMENLKIGVKYQVSIILLSSNRLGGSWFKASPRQIVRELLS
jgi:hypothetical protein